MITVYRRYMEGTLGGESPVYEELWDLVIDPGETTNLALQSGFEERLKIMRKAWYGEIQKARGEGIPAVLRYTVESKHSPEHEKPD